VNYWIFKCNPEQYRLDERLRDAEPLTSWKVTRHIDEIKEGDLSFIWRTGPDRGICAVMRIDSEPTEQAELEDEQKYLFVRDTAIMPRVLGTLTHRCACISHKDLKNIPGLENLSVFRGFQQGTNFKMKNEEGKILMKLVEGR